MIKNLESLFRGDPPAESAGLFGSEMDVFTAQLVVLQVPWQGTASYGLGTAKAPKQIVQASHQLDLYDPVFKHPFLSGIQSYLPDGLADIGTSDFDRDSPLWYGS